MAMPAAHRPPRRSRRPGRSAKLNIGGQVVDLGGLTFGEEDVPLRRRLRAAHQPHELLPFEGDAIGEAGTRRGLLDTGDIGGRRIEAAEAAAILLPERLDGGGIRLDLAFGGAGDRPPGGHLLGEGDGIGGKRILADDPVDQARFLCLFRGDGSPFAVISRRGGRPRYVAAAACRRPRSSPSLTSGVPIFAEGVATL